MPSFVSNGVTLAYSDQGEGFPVLLIHGFGSSGVVNWVQTGWVETLMAAGYRAITIDNRGHGASQKLYEPELYTPAIMAEDAAALCRHLGLERVAVIGYSMGARITAFLALNHPELVVAAVFGGLGVNMVVGLNDGPEIVEALRAPALSDVTHKTGRMFRIFADHTNSDREALVACMLGTRRAITEDTISQITVPVLVAVGSEDVIGGAPEPLAALLPAGEAYVIPRRDHMRATGDARFKQAALDFLSRHLAQN